MVSYGYFGIDIIHHGILWLMGLQPTYLEPSEKSCGTPKIIQVMNDYLGTDSHGDSGIARSFLRVDMCGMSIQQHKQHHAATSMVKTGDTGTQGW